MTWMLAVTISVEALAIPIAVAAFGFAFKVSRDVTMLQTQMAVIWPNVKLNTAMGLHSPDDHHGLDELLVKYAKGTIDRRELAELIDKVRAVQQTGTEEERIRAESLLKMIKVEYQV